MARTIRKFRADYVRDGSVNREKNPKRNGKLRRRAHDEAHKELINLQSAPSYNERKAICTCDRNELDHEDEHFIYCPVIITDEVLDLIGV